MVRLMKLIISLCRIKVYRRYTLLSAVAFALPLVLTLIIVRTIYSNVYPSSSYQSTQELMDPREQAPDNKLLQEFKITSTQPLYFVNKLFYEGIAVFVENRPKDTIPFHIFNVLQHIPVTWPVQIFYGKTNYQYLSENVNFKPYINSGRIILTKLYDESLFRNPNKLYTTITFYEQVRGEKILNFQLDSVFCTNSPHKFSDFLQYDYIGAPWRWTNEHGSVGNSGLSLRSRNKTIELLTKHPYNHYKNEDEWFGKNFHLINASLPTPQVAATFSVESLYYDKPLGIHMPGIYLKETDYQALCKQCPETRMVWPYCQEPHPTSRD